MTDASERIWVWDDEGRDCITHPGYPYPASAIEYVRADLATPLDDPRVRALVESAKNLTDIAHKHTFGKAGILDVHAAVKNTRAALSALEENK